MILQLVKNASPTRQGEQFLAQEIAGSGDRNGEGFQGVPDGIRSATLEEELAPALGSKAGEVACLQRTGLGQQGQSGGKEATFPCGHGPVSVSLIQIRGSQANEERMDIVIDVHSAAREDAIARTDGGRRVLFRAGGDALQTSVKEIGFGRSEEFAFFDAPLDGCGIAVGFRMLQQERPELVAVEPAREDGGIGLGGEDGINIFAANAAAAEFGAVGILGHVRFGAEQAGGVDDGALKGQMLEGVQGVVVNEDADGALRREQVGQLLEQRVEGIDGVGSVLSHDGSGGCDGASALAAGGELMLGGGFVLIETIED
jgi:hypothetical protein